MATRKPHPADTIRQRLRQAAEDSGLTMEQIGLRMGFAKGGAKQAVSRLLAQDGYDPRISTLAAFAAAVDKPLRDLIP
jgi:transcriptional regulator with XRE-family HTH domain